METYTSWRKITPILRQMFDGDIDLNHGIRALQDLPVEVVEYDDGTLAKVRPVLEDER